jgi:repressor LexA
MRGLTKIQVDLLRYLRLHRTRHGYSPTQDEIRTRFGWSSLGTVQKHLRALEAKGYIHRFKHGRRALVPVDEGAPATPLPLLGEVRAGFPVESIEHPEEVEVPGWLVEDGPLFALRVKGTSMLDEGILEGDVLLVRPCAACADGQTVVALLDGEATVKRFRKKGSRVWLEAANPSFPPVEVKPGNDLLIRGVVTAVLRKL